MAKYNNDVEMVTSSSHEDSSHGSRAGLVTGELVHADQLTRTFGFWSMIGLAFSISGTWVALAANLGAGLTNGGTMSLVWGVLIAGGSMYCNAASLGELVSVWPTSLGQAYYVLQMCHSKVPGGRILSYITGWINVVGWWTLVASCAVFTTSFFIVIIELGVPDFEILPWHELLIFEATIWAYAVVNITCTRFDRFLPVFNTIMLITNIMLFVGVLIALLVCTAKNGVFQSGTFIFATFVNGSDWPDGFAFLQGLLSATYGFTALDSVIHMIEELPEPSKNGPRTMVISVQAGILTGFIFLVVVFACTVSMDSLINTNYTIPFAQILSDRLGTGGSLAFLVLLQLNTIISALSITTAGSRLTFGFARDHGLPFSTYFAHVSKYWKVPVRATIGQTCVVAVIGILYLAPGDILTTIISLSTVTLVLACAVPVAVLLVVGRDRLPADRRYNLGRVGFIYNVISVAFSALISVVFFFPSTPSPTVDEINWAIVPFGALTLLAAISWYTGAKYRYSIATVIHAA